MFRLERMERRIKIERSVEATEMLGSTSRVNVDRSWSGVGVEDKLESAIYFDGFCFGIFYCGGAWLSFASECAGGAWADFASASVAAGLGGRDLGAAG